MFAATKCRMVHLPYILTLTSADYTPCWCTGEVVKPNLHIYMDRQRIS